MNPGDVILSRLSEVGGGPTKLRPALLLAALPGPYQTALLCGISTQQRQILTGWDEFIQPTDSDFVASGLQKASVIRLSYLRAVTPTEIVGYIGTINPNRFARLRQRLSDHLRP